MSGFNKQRARLIAGAIALLAASQTAPAVAFEIDTGNPDLRIRFDNTIRYNLGMRLESPDARITGVANNDESDLMFDRGDIVMNRLDLLSEFDVRYQDRAGIRLSGSFWYDNAYSDLDTRTDGRLTNHVSNYTYGRLNNAGKRYYRGPSGELLDAMVYGRIELGDVPVDIKAGRHTVYWGEGLLMGAHAISYSQSPSDGRKAATSPGIESKEVALPLAQISGRAQVTDNLSLAGQYFLEWKPTRAPLGGTFMSSSDIMGADRISVGNGRVLPRMGDDKPRNAGNWGISARYDSYELSSIIGLYYRKFDDYAPIIQTTSTGYRAVYARDVELYGLSVGSNYFGFATNADLSVRRNTALNSSSISTVDNKGARGTTFHAAFSTMRALSASPLWDTASMQAEVAYSRLLDVTHNEHLYRGKGYAACGTAGVSNGCSTRNYVGMALNFTPTYLQALPALDIELPVTINYGIYGNAPTGAGAGTQGSFTWSAGIRAIYAQKHEILLRYTDQHHGATYANGLLTGGKGSPSLNDRGYVSLTYKVGF